MSYIPYQHNYYQPGYYPQPAVNNGVKPKTSVDSVRIDIVNPKASMEPAGVQTVPAYAPYAPVYSPVYNPYQYYTPDQLPNNGQVINNNYNPHTNVTYPPNQVMQQPLPPPPPQPQPVQPQPQPAPPPPPAQPPAPQPEKAPEEKKPEEKKEEPKTEPKKIGNIPESLIAAIDKGLSNPNTEVRIKAATKLLKTFEENPDSKDHPALLVLLNRTLKDPHQNVRLFGEIILKTGAADGDITTQNVLTDMTGSTKAFGQDALMANDILLDIAGRQPKKSLNVVG